MKNKGKRAKFINKGKSADILIYDVIGEDFFFGGISAKSFSADLKALGDVNTLNVFINSDGGSVFEGLTIYNQLHRHKATVNVSIDGLAASIASVIAMAGDNIAIAENAMMMIHKPYGGGIGTADDMRTVADALDKVEETLVDTYVARSGADPAEISGMMQAETWMTAADAIDHGLVDEITPAKQMAAYVNIGRYGYRNVPENLTSAIYTVKPAAKRRKEYAKIIELQERSINA